jgi:hypothetical protein
LIAIAFACVTTVVVLVNTGRAYAQVIPDPGEIELPDLPDLPHVDLPDVEVPDIEVPDVELPDVPDVPDVEPPDPPDIDPDPDNDPGDDPSDDPASDKDGGGGPDGRQNNRNSPGRGDPQRGSGRGAASTSVPPYAHLAAARGDGNLVVVPSQSDTNALSRPNDDDGNTLLELLAPLGFPMLLMVAVGGWLTLQDHLERRNPRRLLDASDSRDRLETS